MIEGRICLVKSCLSIISLLTNYPENLSKLTSSGKLHYPFKTDLCLLRFTKSQTIDEQSMFVTSGLKKFGWTTWELQLRSSLNIRFY